MSYLWGQGVKGQKVLIIIRNHQALYVPNMGNLRSLHTGCVVFLCIKNIFWTHLFFNAAILTERICGIYVF